MSFHTKFTKPLSRFQHSHPLGSTIEPIHSTSSYKKQLSITPFDEIKTIKPMYASSPMPSHHPSQLVNSKFHPSEFESASLYSLYPQIKVMQNRHIRPINYVSNIIIEDEGSTASNSECSSSNSDYCTISSYSTTESNCDSCSTCTDSCSFDYTNSESIQNSDWSNSSSDSYFESSTDEDEAMMDMKGAKIDQFNINTLNKIKNEIFNLYQNLFGNRDVDGNLFVINPKLAGKPATIKKYCIMMKILEDICDLLQRKEKATLRELYYRNAHLAKNQRETDMIVQGKILDRN